MAQEYDYVFKLVLIGDSGVGKSCLLLRFAVRAAAVRLGARAHGRHAATRRAACAWRARRALHVGAAAALRDRFVRDAVCAGR